MEVEDEMRIVILEVPEGFEDVAVEFSREEWKTLSEQEKVLHREVMIQNYENMISVGYNIPVEHLWLYIKNDGTFPSDDTEGGVTVQQKQLLGIRDISRNADFTEVQLLQSSQGKHFDAESERAHPDKMPVSRQDPVQTESRDHTSVENTEGLIKKTKFELYLETHLGKGPYKWLTQNNILMPHCCSLSKQLNHSEKRQKNTFSTGEQRDTREKPYQCATCGKSFAVRGYLVRHEHIHSKQKPYKCATCGKDFTRKDLLVQHQYSHTEDKPYKCATCDKGFAMKAKLIRHEYIHTEEKPYKCTICGKDFARKDHMIRHQLVHTEEKPYKCATCNKSYARKAEVITHQYIRTKEKPHKCSICGKGFVHKNNMIQHQYIHNY